MSFLYGEWSSNYSSLQHALSCISMHDFRGCHPLEWALLLPVGVMPPLMAWQLRSRLLPGSEGSHWMPGGSGMLAALCASAVAVEVGQAAMSYGWL